MFSNAFSSPSKASWVVQGAGLIWLLASFLILNFYGLDRIVSLADATIFSLVFLGAVFVLERIFSFYIPKGGNNWLLLILPILLSLAGTFSHKFLLSLVFGEDQAYRDFLNYHFFLRWVILALAEVLVALLAIVISKLEQQEESRMRELQMNELSREVELAQLRQQLQPHFLFNSLNSISALIVSQPPGAREMVLQLSEFLRGTIRKDMKYWVDISGELEYLKMYLDIERVRFGHRLKVEFVISEEAKSLTLPQLLIQPLLENAIKHGLYGSTGEVLIELKAEKLQNYLVLQISNSFDPETPAPKGMGFGLSSVERRLYLLFGRNDLLTKEKKEGRFQVALKIPLQK